MKDTVKDHSLKIDIIEKWQNNTIGRIAVIVAIVGIIMTFLFTTLGSFIKAQF